MDAITQVVGKVDVATSIRAPSHVIDGGQDVAVRLLGPMATRAPSEAPCDAVRVLHSRCLSSQWRSREEKKNVLKKDVLNVLTAIQAVRGHRRPVRGPRALLSRSNTDYVQHSIGSW